MAWLFEAGFIHEESALVLVGGSLGSVFCSTFKLSSGAELACLYFCLFSRSFRLSSSSVSCYTFTLVGISSSLLN